MTKSNLLKNSVKSALAFVFVVALFMSIALCASAALTEDVIIDDNTVWKYLDDNTDPAEGLSSVTAWTAIDFDDSKWKSAAGSFGSTKGELKSNSNVTPKNLLNLYIDGTTDCIPAMFFRTSVTIEDVSGYKAIAIKMNVDDSVAIYFNGTCIADTRKTVKTTTNLYYTTRKNDTETIYIELSDYQNLLKEGENVIAVQVHNESKSSSDILFNIKEMVLVGEGDPVVAEQVLLNVGASESERNLSWFSSSKAAGEVRLVKAKEVQNGEFPDEYSVFSVKSSLATNLVARFAKAATLTGLEENTEYAYTIVADGKESKIFYFKTGSFSNYSFAFVGDPQVINETDATSWADTVDKVTTILNPDFLISAGDQVNAPENETQYKYFAVDDLSSLALAATVGPGHDSTSPTFDDHFNVPNKSTEYGVSKTSANYWYTYGNTLFMHLNLSNKEAATNGEHKAFMEEAIAANPDAVWKIVVMHTSLFSTSNHGDPDGSYFEDEVGIYRPALTPIFTELDIDAVLSGHDHVYVRTHMMTNSEVSDDTVENNTVTSPEGTLYLCASSATGSKHYVKKVDADFVAYENYEKRKSAVMFDVTDYRLTLTSYFLDNMEVFDTFTIQSHTCQLQLREEIPASCLKGGTRAYYICECGKAYEDAEGTVVIENLAEWSAIAPLVQMYDDDRDMTCNTCGEIRHNIGSVNFKGYSARKMSFNGLRSVYTMDVEAISYAEEKYDVEIGVLMAASLAEDTYFDAMTVDNIENRVFYKTGDENDGFGDRMYTTLEDGSIQFVYTVTYKEDYATKEFFDVGIMCRVYVKVSDKITGEELSVSYIDNESSLFGYSASMVELAQYFAETTNMCYPMLQDVLTVCDGEEIGKKPISASPELSEKDLTMYSVVVENASDVGVAQAFLDELNVALERKGMRAYKLPVIVKSEGWESDLTSSGVYIRFDNSPKNENDEYDCSISLEDGIVTVKTSETKYAMFGAQSLADSLAGGKSVILTFKDKKTNDTEFEIGGLK